MKALLMMLAMINRRMKLLMMTMNIEKLENPCFAQVSHPPCVVTLLSSFQLTPCHCLTMSHKL